MACVFDTPSCAGPHTAANRCGYCAALAQDPELEAMSAIFPLDQMRGMLEPVVAKMRVVAAMPAVPIASGNKRVNKAPVASDKFDVGLLDRSAGDKNCALCSCAGAVNLGVGFVKFTTKKVAKLHGKSDGYDALGGRDEQEQKIIQFVSANLPGYRVVVHGSDRNRMDLPSALAIMKSCPDQTVFVVSISGEVSKLGLKKMKSWGHWLNAVKLAGDVVFVDFQTDHEQRLGRGFVSSQPILGNFGVEYDHPMLQVIAFEPPSGPIVTAAPSSSPRTSVSLSTAEAADPLPLPVFSTTTTQQLVPLADDTRREPTRRQLLGRGMDAQLDKKSKRRAQNFGKLF